MASALRKRVLSLTSNVFRANVVSTAVQRQRLITPSFASRGLSRCLLSVSNQNAKINMVKSRIGVVTCRYASTNSEVEKELLQFLDKEISVETKEGGKLPKLEGWTIKTSRSEVELKNTYGQEEISVKLNVNLSVEAEEDGFEGENPEEEVKSPKMTSKPDFKVEVKKPSGKMVVFHCGFAETDHRFHDEVAEDSDGEILDDLLEIQEVSIQEGEWSDQAYVLSAQTMDGNLYDHFMDFLDERGITEDFMTELAEFCTTYEHGMYVQFLKDLQSVFKE